MSSFVKCMEKSDYKETTTVFTDLPPDVLE